ncbi:MAG: 23S rRNA pseudouridine1911/1915/1917 synthase [Saprospiraceae bacterium]
MNINESHIVPPLAKRIRLSDYLPDIFETIPSKKGIKKAIKKKLVQLNGGVAYTGDYLTGGEVIDLLSDETYKHSTAITFDFEVLFEDEYLAIINKPAGIVVSGNQRRTIENALTNRLTASGALDALPMMQAIHRLDYPTSGALLIGKTRSAVVALNKCFEQRKISKSYLAITTANCPVDGTIAQAINEKAAVSHYKVVATKESNKYGQLTLVQLIPETGRRHQLRIHMSDQGMPIMGDQMYSPEGEIVKGNGLFLFAHSLSFIHPITSEELKICAPIPKKFKRFFDIDLR